MREQTKEKEEGKKKKAKCAGAVRKWRCERDGGALDSPHETIAGNRMGLGCVCTRGAGDGGEFFEGGAHEDFSAAGLSKLTPAELARLDALVRDYQSGALMAAQREVEAAAQAKAVAEARAVAAEAEARAAKATAQASAAKAESDARAARAATEVRLATEAKTAAEAKAAAAEAETQAARTEATRAKESFMGGLLAKAKVVLTPGTEVEYTSVDTQLVGDFRGWSPGTVFRLANGQSWQVTDSSTYATPPESGPHKVRIVPGALGSFFLEIEGVRQKPRVAFVGGGK